MAVSPEFYSFAQSANEWSASAPLVSAISAPVASPSIWDSFASAFTKPFTQLTSGAPTIAGAAGQSLSQILLSKAGLVPKAQQQGTGTVVYYEKPAAGTTPATSINIAQPAASGQANQQGTQLAGLLPSGTNWWIIAIIGAGLIFGLLMNRK